MTMTLGWTLAGGAKPPQAAIAAAETARADAQSALAAKGRR
jgi:hypothetical protein